METIIAFILGIVVGVVVFPRKFTFDINKNIVNESKNEFVKIEDVEKLLKEEKVEGVKSIYEEMADEASVMKFVNSMLGGNLDDLE